MPTKWPRRLRTGALIVATWITWVSAGAYLERGAPFEEAAFGVFLGALFAVAALAEESP